MSENKEKRIEKGTIMAILETMGIRDCKCEICSAPALRIVTNTDGGYPESYHFGYFCPKHLGEICATIQKVDSALGGI